MIKFLTLILLTLSFIKSLQAQESDKEIHSLLMGNWYSFVIDSANQNYKDSTYVEYSFLKHNFDYQMSIVDRDRITPYTIRDGYLVVSWDTINYREYGWNSKIIVIDSNNVLLYSQEDTIRLRRLVSAEYTLIDFMHDRLLLGEATYKMRKLRAPEPIYSSSYSALFTYFQACIIRRDFFHQLARGEAKKEDIIYDLTELYINNCEMPGIIKRECTEFIQMIDKLYPDDQH